MKEKAKKLKVLTHVRISCIVQLTSLAFLLLLFSDVNDLSDGFVCSAVHIFFLQEEHEQRLKREARLEEIRKNMGPTFKVKRKRAELEEKFDELFKDTPKDLHEKMKVSHSEKQIKKRRLTLKSQHTATRAER